MTDWVALFRSLTPSDTMDSIDTIQSGGDCVSRVNCVTSGKSKQDNSLDAAALRDQYDERAALVQFDGGEDRARAEGRAWNEAATAWYVAHGTPTPGGLCAGCGKPLDGAEALDLWPHGERAHAGDDDERIIRYGRRWQAAAARALSAIGIPTPAELVEDDNGPAAVRRWSIYRFPRPSARTPAL